MFGSMIRRRCFRRAYLIAILNESPLDLQVSESLVHLCATIFPATERTNADRRSLLEHIGALLQPGRKWSDKVHLLAAYARVAAADEFLADSLESLLETTCPRCGGVVLNALSDGKS